MVGVLTRLLGHLCRLKKETPWWMKARCVNWLHGLLSFCAKTCESKTVEVGGIPAFRAKEEEKEDGPKNPGVNPPNPRSSPRALVELD